ncbi:hypothetical protein K61PH164C1_LOCUS32 [Klebsiella phage vB_Kpn_K61PH164C1]|uniref:Uncharacterized protein n=1 Tax=Klebsiella phage vB_Kpn_K61PH164C1 TaxID=3071663 RepID=A0AAV1MKR4_9CAUD|nr:hypothetical protein K61PH164C1_LOCUS32 [Klebsiella phage vB_Kpn_K61PH164C1]
MNFYEILFIVLLWLWTINAFGVKETHQLLFNGKVVVTRNNKKWAWFFLATAIFHSASFIYFSVIAA